jgi:transcriptional regulator with XRE-family HTH domain
MARGREGGGSGRDLFAAELAAVRGGARLSQADLALRIHYSESLVAMVESGRRVPTPEFAQRCDEALGLPGTLARLQQHARMTPLPSWFRPYAEVERMATQLRLFEHSLVPGLLQTPDYARAVLATRPDVTQDELSELVASRLDRQQVLVRDRPPRLWVVLDEGVLHRQVGGARVMQDQLLHLATLSHRPGITIEVVPYSAGAHSGLLGACAIADTGDRSPVVYLETLAEGFVTEAPATVGSVLLTFETLRSEALPRGASRDLILQQAERCGPDGQDPVAGLAVAREQRRELNGGRR